MDKKIFKKKIQSILDTKKDINNIEWDSLKNLEILMELDKLFPKKINRINKISQINNYPQLEKILLINKLINE
jgi:acyl carrier protein